MSSLLQSTDSSSYVLVHIVGPLAATVASVGLHFQHLEPEDELEARLFSVLLLS